MRKLLVVLSALLLVAFAVPAFADVSWTGEFTFGGITTFSEGEGAYDYGNLYTDAEWSVDDYNTVLFEFVGSVGGSWTVDAAYLSSDLGSALGLGVGLTVKTGYTSLGTNAYSVSGNGYEAVVDFSTDENGLFFSFDLGTATLDAGFTWADNDYGVVLTVPEVGPAEVSVSYIINNPIGESDFDGVFGAEAEVSEIGPASLALGFYYDVPNEAWAYGLGVSAGFGIATVGACLNGNDTDALNDVGIDLNLAPADEYGIDVGIGLSMAEGAETFQGADVAAYYKVGASTWYVGYLVTDQGYSYDAPTNSAADAGLGGGFYIKGDIDF